MFHQVVWQHMQGLIGFLLNHVTANLPRNLLLKKNYENRLRFDQIMAMSLLPHFFDPPCLSLLGLLNVSKGIPSFTYTVVHSIFLVKLLPDIYWHYFLTHSRVFSDPCIFSYLQK